MTKNIYLKPYRQSTRRNQSKHLQLDGAIRKERSIIKTFDRESVVSEILIAQKKRNIFITNRQSANSSKLLRQKKIVAVLTLGIANRLDESTTKFLAPNAYKIFDIDDLSTFENVLRIRKDYLPLIRSFLSHWLSVGNVLIHCKRGICRSALIVLDYLINIVKMPIDDAARRVVSNRSCIKPTATLLQSIF